MLLWPCNVGSVIETAVSVCFAYFWLECVSVSAERSCYEGGEVAQADEGEEEQGEEDPWCEEGMLICIIRLVCLVLVPIWSAVISLQSCGKLDSFW